MTAGLPGRAGGRDPASSVAPVASGYERSLRPCLALTSRSRMGLGDVWNRTLVYFGIAEEDEDWDEDGYATDEELQRSYERERANVRRLQPRRRERDFDDWSDADERPSPARLRAAGRASSSRALESVPSAAAP